MLGAGDTFRAAASEQLEAWAERSGASFHAAANEKQRPDGVLYQAVEKAKQVCGLLSFISNYHTCDVIRQWPVWARQTPTWAISYTLVW